MDRKFGVYLVVCALLLKEGMCAMTQDQMDRTADMMRKNCQPKFNLSNELIDGIKAGVFPANKDLMCYTNCIMEMMNMVRKGKLLYQSTVQQINSLLPEYMRKDHLTALDICKESGAGIKNNCEAAYAMVQCYYKNNPSFIFP